MDMSVETRRSTIRRTSLTESGIPEQPTRNSFFDEHSHADPDSIEVEHSISSLKSCSWRRYLLNAIKQGFHWLVNTDH